MNEAYYEAKLLVSNRVKDNAVDIDDVNEFIDECDSVVAKLEAENAALKKTIDEIAAENERVNDEAIREHEQHKKALRVLAKLYHTNGSCICCHGYSYSRKCNPEKCEEYLIAYAKQEAKK
jgi:regulator of replication initiation timing